MLQGKVSSKGETKDEQGIIVLPRFFKISSEQNKKSQNKHKIRAIYQGCNKTMCVRTEAAFQKIT
jgi:hypothetical protein